MQGTPLGIRCWRCVAKGRRIAKLEGRCTSVFVAYAKIAKRGLQRADGRVRSLQLQGGSVRVQH